MRELCIQYNELLHVIICVQRSEFLRRSQKFHDQSLVFLLQLQRNLGTSDSCGR